MSRNKQVLIVEDDQEMAGELKNVLQGLGCKVTTLEDPSEAEAILGTHQYEVAFMNMTLPDMTWRRTFTTVKNASRSTTIIMMSRSPEENDVRLALSAGAYIVLERPLRQQQFDGLLSPQNDGMFVSLRE